MVAVSNKMNRLRGSPAHSPKRASKVGALLSIAAVPFLASPVFAASILHVGPGVNSPCATGGCYVYGNEVNGITGNEADIYVNSNDPNLSFSTLDVILGIPDTASFNTANAFTSATTYEGPNGSAEANLTATFVPPSETLTAGQDAYSQFGYTQANNSNSFTNWSAADSSVNGINTSQFNLYQFRLTLSTGGCLQTTCNGIDLEGNELVDLIFSTPLPLGSYVIGYGTQTKNDRTSVYDTPFTESGLVDSEVAEPGTIALFGLGLLGCALAFRRRRAPSV